MKKPSYKGERFQPEKEEDFKAVVVEIQADSKIKIGLVQSLLDATISYSGRESGKQYTWNGAGAIVEVNEEDIPELLAKRRGKKPCCGAQESPIFQLLP
jgi:hypothetical protein